MASDDPGRALKAHFDELDGARAPLLVTVMFVHVFYCGFGLPVELFFVLSGFLIVRILAATRSRPARRYFRDFFTNRAVRILPAYVVYCLLLGAFYIAAGKPQLFGDYWPWLASLTYNFSRARHDWMFSQYFTHLWSISLEAQAYLFWAIVAFCMPLAWLRSLCWILLALAPLLRLALAQALDDGIRTGYDIVDTIYWFTPCQLDAFAFGALLALSQGKLSENESRIVLWQRLSAVLVLTAGALMVAFLTWEQGWSWKIAVSFGYPLNNHRGFQYVWGFSLVNFAMVMAMARLLCSGQRGWWLARLLRWNPIVRIGCVSYEIYIFHWAVILAVEEVVAWPESYVAQALKFTLVVGASFAVGSFASAYIQAPFQRLRRVYSKAALQ